MKVELQVVHIYLLYDRNFRKWSLKLSYRVNGGNVHDYWAGVSDFRCDLIQWADDFLSSIEKFHNINKGLIHE